MKQPGWQHGIAATVLLAWAGGVCGQSVDTSMARAAVGQPLSMAVQVRGFDWPASRLTPDCIAVQIQQGDSGEEVTPLRVRTIPSGDDGRVLVQISSTQRVSDTLLLGRLSLLCGADYTREFTVLVDPPVAGTATPRTPSTPVPKPVTPPLAATANAVRAEPPSPVTSTARPLEEADLQRLTSAVVAALALSQASPPLPPPLQTADADTHPTAATALPWQDLREEQRQTRASLVALVARIERSEREAWRGALLVMGAVLGLSASLLVLRLVREGLMPHIGAPQIPTRPARRPRPGPTRPGPDAEANSETLSPSASSLPNPADHGFVNWSPPPPPPPLPATTARLPPSPGSTPTSTTHPDGSHPPLTRRWPDADFGHPNLDMHHASAQLLQELEPHVEESPIGVAVVLERRLQELPGKCPWILLRLLALYWQMAQPWNHERVAAQLESLYNVRIPAMEADPTLLHAADLEAYPETLDRIRQAWSLDDSAATLSSLLLRPTVIEVLDQPAFEEVLLLHGILRQRQSAWLTAVEGGSGHVTGTTTAPPAANRHLMELLAA